MAGRKKHRYRKPLTTLAYKDPKPLIRRAKPTGALGMTKAEIDAVINGTLNNGNTLSPNGRCHDCGRKVSGERKFCGTCMTKHDYNL